LAGWKLTLGQFGVVSLSWEVNLRATHLALNLKILPTQPMHPRDGHPSLPPPSLYS